jgi:hypothetical protein
MAVLPSLQQLRFLCALAEQCHFGRAAESCAVTQSTLSGGIKELEARLGITLFERSHRHVMLTPFDGRFYGLASQRIRPQIGSQIRSRKPAAGNKLPAISFVTGTGPMVRSSSEGFDRWAFAIDRRRRAPLGKMDMLKG